MGQVITQAPGGVPLQPDCFSAVVLCDVGRVEVALRGDLDVGSVPVLVAAIAPLLTLDGCVVELDGRQLSFLDASGIGCIVRLRCALRARGGELSMWWVSARARRVLTVCDMSDLLADAELLAEAGM